MADQEVVNQENVGQAEAAKSAEPSSLEIEARNLGWVPKEEYEGDEYRWLDAGEFVRRQPLYDRISQQSKELKDIKRTMAQFAQHHAKVREVEYQRALDSLESKKVVAFEEGNAQEIVKLDKEIRVVEKAKDQFVAEQNASIQQDVQSVHPEFEAWTNRNTWYTTDKAMQAYADTIGTEIAAKGKPDGDRYTPAEVLKLVEKRVRDEFPKRFSNPNREKPGSVEATSSRGNKSVDGFTPSDFERRVAEKFVKQGLYKNTSEYYKELQLMDGKS